MGCCVSAKKNKVTLEPSSSTAQVTTASPDRKKGDAPVDALLKPLTVDLKEEPLSATSLVGLEARQRSRSPMPEIQTEVLEPAYQAKLPDVKAVSRENGFDKERFRVANKGTQLSPFSLSLRVQEQLAEVEVLGRVSESTKPASSLALLSQKGQSKPETSMENYISARTIIYT